MEQAELRNLIDYLHQRRDLLNTAIADLEQLCNLHVPAPRRPGRKSVDMKERQQISERMKARWAVRRSGQAVATSGGS